MLQVGEQYYQGWSAARAASAPGKTKDKEERSFAGSVLDKIEQAGSEKDISARISDYEEYRRRQRYLENLEEERRLSVKRKRKKEAEKRLLKEYMKKALLKKRLLKQDCEKRTLNKILAKRAMVGKENYREFLMKGSYRDRKPMPELPALSGVSAEEIFGMFFF